MPIKHFGLFPGYPVLNTQLPGLAKACK